MKKIKNWLYKEYSSKLPQHIVDVFLKEGIPSDKIISASKIVHFLSEMPWYTQKNLLEDTGLSKKGLIKCC